MVKFVHFEFVRIKGKRNVAVGAATGVRCWESGMLLVLPGESGMLLVCLETQCKSDKILPRREISVDHEHVLLLLLLAAVAARCCCCSLLMLLAAAAARCCSL